MMFCKRRKPTYEQRVRQWTEYCNSQNPNRGSQLCEDLGAIPRMHGRLFRRDINDMIEIIFDGIIVARFPGLWCNWFMSGKPSPRFDVLHVGPWVDRVRVLSRKVKRQAAIDRAEGMKPMNRRACR